MPTGRSLTIYRSLLLGGCLLQGGWGVSAPGGCVCSGGVSAPGGWVSTPWGSVCSGGVCSEGCLLLGGVSKGGVCSRGCLLWGVSAPRRFLLPGVPAPRGCGVSALGGLPQGVSAPGGPCTFLQTTHCVYRS